MLLNDGLYPENQLRYKCEFNLFPQVCEFKYVDQDSLIAEYASNLQGYQFTDTTTLNDIIELITNFKPKEFIVYDSPLPPYGARFPVWILCGNYIPPNIHDAKVVKVR